MTDDPRTEHNEAMKAHERALCELTARVFSGADPVDRTAWLQEFAAFCGAFDRHAVLDPAMRDLVQGKRLAFFWLADHLQLDLAACWPRYLMPTREAPK